MKSEAIQEARRREAWAALVGQDVTVRDFVYGDRDTSPETMVLDYLNRGGGWRRWRRVRADWPAWLGDPPDRVEAAGLLVDIVTRGYVIAQFFTAGQGRVSISLDRREFCRASNRGGNWRLYTPEPNGAEGPSVTHIIHNHDALVDAAVSWIATLDTVSP